MKKEPLWMGVVVKGVVALGAKYGLDLDAGEILVLLLALEPVVTTILRARVTPNETADARVLSAMRQVQP